MDKLRIKILSPEEYERLKEEDENSIVSELRSILIENQIVAVEQGDEYKIIKYLKVASVFNEDEDDKLNIVVSKEELQQFIFLQGL